jgi:hypothetical protein
MAKVRNVVPQALACQSPGGTGFNLPRQLNISNQGSAPNSPSVTQVTPWLK